MGSSLGLRTHYPVPKGMMIFILKAIRDIGVPVDGSDIQAYLRKKSINTTGSISVQLWRLEMDGYVRTERLEPCMSGRGRPRKLYELTQKGEEAVLEMIRFFSV